jgi:hypothetical protein
MKATTKYKVKHIPTVARVLVKDANGKLKVTGTISEGKTFEGNIVSVTTPASGSMPARTDNFVLSSSGEYVAAAAMEQNKKKKNIWTVKSRPFTAYSVKIVNGKRDGNFLSKLYPEGSIIEGGAKVSMTVNVPVAPNSPPSTKVVEYIPLGKDVYVLASQVESVTFSAEGAAPAATVTPVIQKTTTSKIKDIIMDKGILYGGLAGGALATIVGVLMGVNTKTVATLAGIGVVAGGIVGNGMKSESFSGADGKGKGKSKPSFQTVACYGAGYAYHTSGHCKAGETQG